jgi:hypothetical protein
LDQPLLLESFKKLNDIDFDYLGGNSIVSADLGDDLDGDCPHLL